MKGYPIFFVLLFFLYSKSFSQSTNDTKWSKWNTDTVFNQNHEIIKTTKYKYISDDCYYHMIIASKYQNGKWYWKQKREEKRGCFGGTVDIKWIRKRKVSK